MRHLTTLLQGPIIRVHTQSCSATSHTPVYLAIQKMKILKSVAFENLTFLFNSNFIKIFFLNIQYRLTHFVFNFFFFKKIKNFLRFNLILRFFRECSFLKTEINITLKNVCMYYQLLQYFRQLQLRLMYVQFLGSMYVQ